MAFKNKEIIDFVKNYCNNDTIGLIVVKNRNDGNIQSHLKHCVDDDSVVFNLYEISRALAAMAYNKGVAECGHDGVLWDDLDPEMQAVYHDMIQRESIKITRCATAKTIMDDSND